MYKTQGNSKNDIFTATFTIEELEEAIMKTKAKNNLDLMGYSLNL